MTNNELNKIKDQIPFGNQAFQNETFWKVWFTGVIGEFTLIYETHMCIGYQLFHKTIIVKVIIWKLTILK